MSEEFIPNSKIYSAPPSDPAPTQPSREPILITIIGSATGLDLVVKILHRLGFAEAGSTIILLLYPLSSKGLQRFKL